MKDGSSFKMRPHLPDKPVDSVPFFGGGIGEQQLDESSASGYLRSDCPMAIANLLQRGVEVVSAALSMDHALVLELDCVATQPCLFASIGWDQAAALRFGKQLAEYERQPESGVLKNITAGETRSEGEIYALAEPFLREHDLGVGVFITVPCRTRNLALFAGRSGSVSFLGKTDVGFLDAIMNTLGMAVEYTDTELARHRELLIEGKHQWQFTLDVLPQLMFLLDENGQVIWANRTLEAWKLGDVKLVKGQQVHHILHPHCNDSDCLFKATWEQQWQQLTSSDLVEREFYLASAKRYLRYYLCKANKSHYQDDTAARGYAFLLCEDISRQKSAEQSLENHNDELEKQLFERTLELKKANADLTQVEEEERRRIASELHDNIGQGISTVLLSMRNIEHDYGEMLPQAGNQYLADVIAKLQDTIEDVRCIATDLRPSMLDDLGLLATVGWFCREFGTLVPSIKINVQTHIEESEIPPSLKIVVFRILQEALNNVAKHSKANNLSVSLAKEGDVFSLNIQDDGQGFVAADGNGYGLGSMRRRAIDSGGTFTIESSSGEGALVHAQWPCGPLQL
jgi:signal transduction histidine kinase